MNRKQMILAGALAIQVVLILVLKMGSSSPVEAGQVRPLLPELADLVPMKVEIGSGEGDSISLKKDGDLWTLENVDGFPADGGKVDTMLQDLSRLKVRRPVVTSSRYHKQLKVSDDSYERHIRIWSDPEGEPDVDFLVGNSPNYRISDVRRQGEDEVYEVMGLSPWDVEAGSASWINKKLVDVDAGMVTGLKVTNGKGTFGLSRDDGIWSVTEGDAGGDLDQSEVDALVRAYGSVFMADPVGRVDAAAQGLEQPAAVVELILSTPSPEAVVAESSPDGTDSSEDAVPAEDGPAAEVVTTTVALQVGGTHDEATGTRYATVTDFGFTVTLNKFDAERATEKTLADLLIDEGETE